MSGLIKVKQLKSGNEPYGKPLITDGNGGFTYDSGLTSTAISNTIIQPWADINRCGFVDNEQTAISFNDSTYLFTLSGLTTWSYYRRGIKYNITGNRTITIPSESATYYITINSTDGTLQYSTAVWTLKDSTLPVAVIRLNINNTPKYHLSDERHTIAIDRRLHLYLHQTRGTQFVDGGVLDGPSLNTATDAGTTFGISLTTIADEDLYEDLSPLVRPSGTTLVYNIYYRINTTTWSWSPSEVPFLYSPTYILWDNNGTMTTGIHNSYYNTYLLYTNQNGSARYSIVHGRGQYSSLTSAQSESPLTFDWSGFPVEESVIAYQFTWATSNSYSNKGKCRLEGSKLINVATIRTATSSGGIDHNSLSGLQGGLPTERYHLSGVDYSITVAMSSVVSSEISSRVSGDLSLSTALSSEISSTNSDVNSLSSAISLEVSSRTSGDLSLSTALSTANSIRSSADVSLSTAISTRVSVDSSLSTSLNTEISQRISADASILAAIPSNNLSGLTSVNNTFLGYQAGLNSISDSNTFIGVKAGLSNTTGSANTFVGHNAGRNNTSGQYNIFIGYLAGTSNTEGFDNMYIGYGAGASLVNGSFNTYIGRSAGNSIIDGNTDTIIGSYTGHNLISSSSNVIIGHRSAGLSTESYGNVYIGTNAGYSNNGLHNIFIGTNAGWSGYTNIDDSIFIGTGAGQKETESNTFILDNINRVTEIDGRNKALLYGKFNSVLSNQFLRINGKFFVSGLTNGVTTSVVYYDTTTNELSFGAISGGDSYWQKSGTSVYNINDNIVIGANVAYHKLTIVGSQSKSGTFENLFSINSNDSADHLRLVFGLDNNATETSRGAVIQSIEEGVGYRNLLLNPDGGNVGIGVNTPDLNYCLDVNGLIKSENIKSNPTTRSTKIGYQTALNEDESIARYNTIVGYQAGYGTTTGVSNVFLGYQAGFNETGSNKLYISNTSTSNPLIYGEFNNSILRINGKLYLNNITNATQTNVLCYNSTSKEVTYLATSNLSVNYAVTANCTHLLHESDTDSNVYLTNPQTSEIWLTSDIDYQVCVNFASSSNYATNAGSFNNKYPSFYNTQYYSLISGSYVTVNCSFSNNFYLSTTLTSFTLELTNTSSGQRGTILLDLKTGSTNITISNTPTAYKSGLFTSLNVGKKLIEWFAYSSYILYKIAPYA